jgi:hypothetical protein
MRNARVTVLFGLPLLVALSLLIWSLAARPSFAAPPAQVGCKQWEIKFMPPKPGKVEIGWEPISGVLYGEGGEFGVLLRRCAG